MFHSVLFADIVLYNVSSYRITLSVRPWKRGMVWCGLALPRLRIYEGDILCQSLQAPLIRRFYSVLLCYVRFVLLFRVLSRSVLHLSWFLMESGMFCSVLCCSVMSCFVMLRRVYWWYPTFHQKPNSVIKDRICSVMYCSVTFR
jgi:hypothetical protein